MGSHAQQFAGVHVPILENVLADDGKYHLPESSAPCTAPACRLRIPGTPGLSHLPRCNLGLLFTRRRPLPVFNRDPDFAKLFDDTRQMRGIARRDFKIPAVIAPAMRNVPASIRSGMMACVAPCNSDTPSIVIVGVPAPLIFAPILSEVPQGL